MGILEFIVRSPTEEFLCYFPGFVIIYKAAINIYVKVFFMDMFSNQFDKYLGVQLLDCIVR